jgi:protein gp37
VQKSSIGWTDETWNPISGCDKVSPGCKHCYAERTATHPRYARGFPNGFDFTIRPNKFWEPSRLRKPRLIFVNSMSDFFHEKMPLETLKQLFRIMGSCPRHTFQILTKRHERLLELSSSLEWHDNIWMGVSIENQDYVQRANFLKRVPAKVRFLSCEPLLGPLELNLDGIHWVLIGGESGHRCRPMDLEWARSIRDQCESAGVACFVKQLGGYPNKRHEIADFPIDLMVQEFPYLNRPATGASLPAYDKTDYSARTVPSEGGVIVMHDQTSNGSSAHGELEIVPTEDDGQIITKSDRLAELERKLDVANEEHELARVALKKLTARVIKEIHDDKLYKEAGYSSFGTYIKERWNYSRGHANRLIQFAKEIELSELSPNGDTPKTEGEARVKRLAQKNLEKTMERSRSLTQTAIQCFQGYRWFEHDLPSLPAEEALEWVNKVPVTKREAALTIAKEAHRLWELSLPVTTPEPADESSPRDSTDVQEPDEIPADPEHYLLKTLEGVTVYFTEAERYEFTYNLEARGLPLWTGKQPQTLRAGRRGSWRPVSMGAGTGDAHRATASADR